jgi:hypothetical protein
VAHSSRTVYTMRQKHTWLVTVDIADRPNLGLLSVTHFLTGAGFECEFIRRVNETVQYWVHHHHRTAMTQLMLTKPEDVRPFEYTELSGCH